MNAVVPVLWLLVALVAVWWPSRFIGPLDGVPLDRPLEALALGLALPWLFWLGRDAVHARYFRGAAIALLIWKLGASLVATQQGLCATFQAPQPLSGTAMGMRIDEPHGFLRSWDLRADLWSEQPRCTAIVTRPFETAADFPAWFVNITDQMQRRRDFALQVSGFVTASGRTRPANESMTITSEAMRFTPTLDQQPLFDAGLVTVNEPRAIDRFLSPWAWIVAPLLCLVLIAQLARSAMADVDRSLWIWVVFSAAAAVAVANANGMWVRSAGILTLGAVAVPVTSRLRNLRGAFLLVGVPWLAFFAAYSFAQIGRFSIYSEDDWLAYQIAGYRIVMNGHWIEGGTPTFDFQPLYRWITGALHLVFGDSSVGEMYWDASCLAFGALLAFSIVCRSASFRWAVAAGALTLATLTLATPWYIIGRGLSEITAAGFGFLAIASLIRADGRRLQWVSLAAMFAAVMFYTRLNQLLWAPTMIVMLLPFAIGSDFATVRSALSHWPWKPAAIFLGAFSLAVVAFMARTQYFTGHFSLFYGTALHHNDTGLRPWRLFDPVAWSKVGHSLMGFVFMNEPPRVDPRAAVVAAGAVVTLAALLQTPIARRIPAGLLLVTIGGVLGAFVAHSHGYPGRFTIHILPLAAALTTIAASALTSPGRAQ